MTENLETTRLLASVYEGGDPDEKLAALLADLGIADEDIFESAKGLPGTVFAHVPELRVVLKEHKGTVPLYGCGHDATLAPIGPVFESSKAAAAADLVREILKAGNVDAKSTLLVVEPETREPIRRVVFTRFTPHP